MSIPELKTTTNSASIIIERIVRICIRECVQSNTHLLCIALAITTTLYTAIKCNLHRAGR